MFGPPGFTLGLQGLVLGLPGFALGLPGFALGPQGFALAAPGFALGAREVLDTNMLGSPTRNAIPLNAKPQREWIRFEVEYRLYILTREEYSLHDYSRVLVFSSRFYPICAPTS